MSTPATLTGALAQALTRALAPLREAFRNVSRALTGTPTPRTEPAMAHALNLAALLDGIAARTSVPELSPALPDGIAARSRVPELAPVLPPHATGEALRAAQTAVGGPYPPTGHTMPATSHEAAPARPRAATTRAEVLDTLRLYWGKPGETFTLADVVKRHQWRAVRGEVAPASESGIRTRVSELARDGMVAETGRVTRYEGKGRAHRLLQLTDEGHA